MPPATLRPQYGRVRLNAGPIIDAGYADNGKSSSSPACGHQPHPANNFGGPDRIAGKVNQHSGVREHTITDLHDVELISFRKPAFARSCQKARVEIALNVDIQERGGSSQRHCTAILRLPPPDRRSRATVPLPARSAPGGNISRISPPFRICSSATMPANFPHAGDRRLQDSVPAPDSTADRRIRKARVRAPDNDARHSATDDRQ